MKKLIILTLVCIVSYSALAAQNAAPCQQETCEQPSFTLTGFVSNARPVKVHTVDLLDPPENVEIGSCEAIYDEVIPDLLDRCKRTLKAFARDLCD